MATFERIRTGVQRGTAITVIVDGVPVQAFDGETVATVLLAADRVAFRTTPKRGQPRGAFCGMGVCFDCLVTIDGLPRVRACMAMARDGMIVDTRETRDTPHDSRHGDPHGSL